MQIYNYFIYDPRFWPGRKGFIEYFQQFVPYLQVEKATLTGVEHYIAGNAFPVIITDLTHEASDTVDGYNFYFSSKDRSRSRKLISLFNRLHSYFKPRPPTLFTPEHFEIVTESGEKKSAIVYRMPVAAYRKYTLRKPTEEDLI
jgi:hypothetical protein